MICFIIKKKISLQDKLSLKLCQWNNSKKINLFWKVNLYYSYCRICKKKFCLNYLISHNYCLEKMKNDNFKLKDVNLDKKIRK